MIGLADTLRKQFLEESAPIPCDCKLATYTHDWGKGCPEEVKTQYAELLKAAKACGDSILGTEYERTLVAIGFKSGARWAQKEGRG